MRFYLDTSVFGGYYDKEFDADTRKLFAEIVTDRISVLITSLTVSELSKAPEPVRAVFDEISSFVEIIEIDEEMIRLAKLYLKEGALTNKYISDATHIAAATILKADALISWNFRHMVNFFRIRRYNGINLMHGYSELDIRSPREVLS
jgi:predicted nucleic acid-binding protein